ncbi:Acg family FMN-binding oxidoreductase [Novispirillum itersonii]|uniref:Nitroreductase n=1 Tax=Novispirillum itersonii TaxID=189 RepID=A0A7W9ZG03_NOVIT|nr:hypothetical protein [Novispirillum itersonii]MBB6210788.1 nitroreductase [Novispirillum itersonii]
MPLTRRGFLTGLLTAASAPALLSGCIGDDDDAYGPWQGPAPDRDVRVRLTAWASLAPSSLNLQPWTVMLEGDSTLHLLADPERLHPVTDPTFRQTTISQGTFLELLSLAAAAEGYRATITLFPEGPYQTAREMKTHPVATVTLERDAAVLPPGLFAAVRTRRTSQQPFSLRALTSAERTALLAEARSVPGVGVGYLDRGPAFERLRALALEGLRLETATDEVAKEMARFIRLTPDEVARRRDGKVPLSYAMGVPIRMLYGSYAFTDPESYLLRTTMARVAAQPETAAAFAWMVTAENSREDQIRVGRAYMRLDLQAAALGLGIQPLSGTLAGYPQAQPVRRDVEELLAGPGQQVQMLFRLGKLARPDRLTPRRAVTDLIVKATG